MRNSSNHINKMFVGYIQSLEKIHSHQAVLVNDGVAYLDLSQYMIRGQYLIVK
jgi:hypothetical protein